MLSVRGTFENGIAHPDEPVSPRLRRELQACLDAGEWLREILQSPRATAILIVDAFRFDPREAMQAEHLFKPLPPTVSDDSAFHDRWAAYLPGWEMPKLTNELITDHVGFILDYTSELYHRELRRIGHYGSLWQRWFEAPEGQWSTRDTRSVNRTFSGLTKLIFPSGLMDKEDRGCCYNSPWNYGSVSVSSCTA